MYIYRAQPWLLYLLRVVLTWRSVNGICTLVHQANFSEGGFAKLVPLPTLLFFIVFFFFFFFFFVYCFFLSWFGFFWDYWSFIFSFVCNKFSWGRQGKCGGSIKLGLTLSSEEIRKKSRKIQYSRTSVARTPMARLPWLIRTRFWVPTKCFR